MAEILSQVKSRFRDEWIAFKVIKKVSEADFEGELIDHDLDRRELHKRLRENKVKDAYVTFAGPVIKPGYATLLWLDWLWEPPL